VKFTQQGKIVIAIELVKQDEAEATLRFSINDTGIGMTKKQQGSLFHAFSLADSSTTREYGGTGLGLSISKHLVKMMGGKISVQSARGQGSTFTFTAVFTRLSAEAQQKQSMPQDLRDLHVLIVDDSEITCKVLRDMLEAFSFRVEVAPSGDEALAKVDKASDQNIPFELILMAWQMPPGMDGLEISQLIKNNAKLQTIPAIIMITSFGREEIMHQTKAEGLDGFLIKPITPSMMLNTLMNIFVQNNREGKTGWVKSKTAYSSQLQYIHGANVLLVRTYDFAGALKPLQVLLLTLEQGD
jgi:two-component system sensor histidine kinase/response regulator